MRCNPLRWLWGIPLILALSWITFLGEYERIQSDLKQRTERELSSAGHDWASTIFKGRDGIIVGKAADDAEPADATGKARRVWGVRILDQQTELIEKADRFIWSATHRDNKLSLTGFVPNEAARKAVLGMAKAQFPKAELSDAMKVARGAPARDPWLGGVGFGLKQLAGLKRGSVDLNALDLSIAGEANDFASYRGVKTALNRDVKDIKDVKVVSDKVTPPLVNPYTWSAKLAGSQLVLAGHVPSDKLREDLFAHTKKTFTKIAIVDRMETADGAPDGWLKAAIASVDQLTRLKDGAAELSATDLTLSGMAADESTAGSIREDWRKSVPKAFKLADTIKFPKPEIKTVSPYVTTIDAGAGAVEVTGHVPSEAARAALIEAVKARLPGRTVNDRLQIGAGAPEGWQTCIMAGVNGLGRIGGGRASISDRRLDIIGQTDDEAMLEKLPQDMRTETNRACDPDVKLTLLTMAEPDLTWRAVFGGAGELVLEGDVIDGSTRSELLQSAAKLFPNTRVIDRMTVANARSAKWPRMAELGLKSLAKLRKGEAVLARQELTVRGEARDTVAAGAVKDQLQREAAKGYAQRDIIEVRSDAVIWAEEEARKKLTAQQTAEEDAKRRQAEAEAKRRADDEAKRLQAEADARRRTDVAAVDDRKRAEASNCQSVMSALAKEGIIQFQRASFELDSRSLPTLDKLAKAAGACPGARIEIEGHTDAEGTPERNARLSQRRAEAVASYLSKAGVGTERVKAIGYGETRPLAPNDTAANRAKNRRIEFQVIAQ